MKDLRQQISTSQTMTTGNKEAIKEIAEELGIEEKVVKSVILNFFSYKALGHFLKKQIEVTIISFGVFKTNAKGKFLLTMKEKVMKRRKREREKRYKAK